MSEGSVRISELIIDSVLGAVWTVVVREAREVLEVNNKKKKVMCGVIVE